VNTFATRIQPSVQTELDAARIAEARGDFDSAFHRLERAHVLGQAATVQHVRVHWHMLRFALRNGFRRQVAGQVWRLLAAAVFTAPGLVPEGNTGGVDISGFQRLPVPDDLRQALDAARA
jgi:hypothetical protein